jgi:hypothetical protein
VSPNLYLHRRIPKDRDPVAELALTQVAGHLTFTAATVTAWYRLPEQVWAFRADPDREGLLATMAAQFAGLVGHRLHLRRTTRPFSVCGWDDGQRAANPAPLPPGMPWERHLSAAVNHLLAGAHTQGHTLLGVQFARRRISDTVGWLRRGRATAEATRLDERVRVFDDMLVGYGLGAVPATAEELAWLLYRSVGLGLDPPPHIPGSLDPGDVLALTERVERYRDRYGATTRLVDRVTGQESHVAVLTVGRIEDQDIPQMHEPWLHLADQLPWPVETSSRVDILGPEATSRRINQQLLLIRSQQRDWRQHEMDVPQSLDRLAGRALDVSDEVDTGRPVDATRAHGWHRLAVTAPTEKQCLDRVAEMVRLYAQHSRIDLRHPKHQDRLAAEFIPGQPIANTGYLRRMPVGMFAAALPQAAAIVGDGRGDYIGHTAGAGRRVVMFDPHFPMQVRERSGLAVFVAEPGGGKSTLIGALGYLAARRGVQVTLLDPSGPLARLAEMPELAGHARVVNLAGAQTGTLAPYALVPTPRRCDYPDGPVGDAEHDTAVSTAQAERKSLVLDLCMMLLPPQTVRLPEPITALRSALRKVPADEDTALEDVIDQLNFDGDAGDVDAKNVANLLGDAAELPLARLFFGHPPAGMLTTNAALTIITMAGLRLPDLGIEREYWSSEESLALPMLHLANRLAVRRCYGGDMHARKLVGLDEAHFMNDWPSGRAFLVRLGRDSRKWNIAGLVASQNPKDILGLDVQNLVSTVFVGRIAEDPEIAAEALRLLGVPVGVGYEQTLAALSQVAPDSTDRLGYREFVMRDVDGRVQKIVVDLTWAPDLLDRLNTTPGGS